MLHRKGFTLLEILLVVAALSILAAIVIVAINPTKQLGDTRNAQRYLDVGTILNAVYQYAIDKNGDITLLGLDADENTYQVLGTDLAGCDTTCGDTVGTLVPTVAACVNMTNTLTPNYLVAIPRDPRATDANTDYYINRTTNGRITVGACDPEQTNPSQTKVIEVKR